MIDMNRATELFFRKLATGLYTHYDAETLQILYDDCVKQVGMTDKCFEAYKKVKSGADDYE